MKSVKILLVEDNDDDVVLVQDVFEQIPLGNDLKTVSNGEAALALLRGRESGGVLPGLIILDINMPLMDGFEVLRELKGDRRLMKIPVVMLTGSNREEDRQRALELGASAFLTKPLDFEKLREAIVPLTLSWGISRKEDEPISA